MPTHGDGHANTHIDEPFGEGTQNDHIDHHTDTSDFTYIDSHTDETIPHQNVGHIDTHTDDHTDMPTHGDGHANTHIDEPFGEGTQNDHIDHHTDTSDFTYIDSHTDETIPHQNVGHIDTHTDDHTDMPTHGDGHANTHIDEPFGEGTQNDHIDHHTDTSDFTYIDSHTDETIPHQNVGHIDTHSDMPPPTHQDSHDDVPHSDVDHLDSHLDGTTPGGHTNIHNDVIHSDTHTDDDSSESALISFHIDEAAEGSHQDEHGDHTDTENTSPALHADTHIDEDASGSVSENVQVNYHGDSQSQRETSVLHQDYTDGGGHHDHSDLHLVSGSRISQKGMSLPLFIGGNQNDRITSGSWTELPNGALFQIDGSKYPLIALYFTALSRNVSGSVRLFNKTTNSSVIGEVNVDSNNPVDCFELRSLRTRPGLNKYSIQVKVDPTPSTDEKSTDGLYIWSGQINRE